MRRAAFLIVLLAVPMFASSADAASMPTYHISKSVPLGAPDRWDYITFDPASHRVYVAHGDHVTVVDGWTGTVVGDVEGMPGGTHGIVTSHATGTGYTDDGRAGEAVVFNLKTLKVLKRIKAEPDADGIFYDRPSGHIFVIDGDSGKLTVIDPKKKAAIATIDAGGGLEFGVSGDNGKAYVDGAEKNEIVRVDTKTNTADAHWAMPGCVRPHGLAIDVKHHRLFASCSNKVMNIVNADDGTVIATEPIGEGTDFAVFDPKQQRAYSSNREGTLSVVWEKTPDEFVSLPAIPTEYGARTMAIDSGSGRIYVVTADIKVDSSAAPTDYRHRYKVTPGSVRLLFLDRRF